MTVAAIEDDARPFTTPLRPRNVTGAVSLACERTEGRPCGDGVGGFLELDTGIGYGDHFVAGLRIRGVTGSGSYNGALTLDRVLVRGRIGKFGATVGRDVLAIGPSARTRIAWGENAPPIDQVRIETVEPLRVNEIVNVAGVYALARLRAPQTFPDNVVSIARGELLVSKGLVLGATHLLQLGGDGATTIGVVDFFLEHVRRKDLTASATDSSNRRAGIDASVTIEELWGMRVYGALMFEDARQKWFLDALKHDTDLLLGVQVHGVTAEWLTTGVRSHEHEPRTTGLTNAARVVGAPLGPDSSSVYTAVAFELGGAAMEPWIEWVRLASDTYMFTIDGPISRVITGPTESRYRTGISARVPLLDRWWLEAAGWLEYVDHFAYEAGATRTNAGLRASLAWYPRRTGE